MAARRFDAAVSAFGRCVEQRPDNPDYICWMADAMAFHLEERAMQKAPRLFLLAPGKKMRDLYQKALALNPHHVAGRLGRAVMLRDLPAWAGGDVAAAEAILKEILLEHPRNLAASHFLGTLYIRKTGQYEKGITILQKAVALACQGDLQPVEKLRLARLYHALGKAFLENRNNPGKGISLFEKSLAIDPDSVVTLLDLSRACHLAGQATRAQGTVCRASRIIDERKYHYFDSQLQTAMNTLQATCSF